ncbi:hypothetical protein FUAX_43680 (plasmid) [Fulvitalea axinellae]|uniref:F5/8 type C domain-containing protein n=1 Tax=Fulvitalea axinellae TaxID=1182444 RepID=A0AAU9DFL8_9BACT|nr:hypothetical protein FUAX_43680 [Fulvitalea axinellae]
MRHIYRSVLALCAGAAMFSCQEDELDVTAPGEDKFDLPVLHVINDVSQYWDPNLFGSKEGFLSFLDDADGQYETVSFPVPGKAGGLGKNAWNIFLNTKVNLPYTASDIQALKDFHGKGKALCFFAMENGQALTNPNALAGEFGFGFSAGPVGNLSNTDGGSVEAMNNGFFLDLKTAGDWNVLVKSGDKPVVAVKKEGKKTILASGIDLFSGLKQNNADFYKSVMLNIAKESPGLVSASKIQYAGLPVALSTDNADYLANEYLKDRIDGVKARIEAMLPHVKDLTGLSEDGDLRVLLTVSDQLPDVEGETVVLGGFIGDYPNQEKGMSTAAAMGAYQWLSNYQPDVMGNGALALLTAVKAAENAGLTGLRDEFVAPIIQMAKAHPAYASFDPFGMELAEAAKYPRYLGLGKALVVLEGLAEKHGDDFLKDFFAFRNERLPAGFDSNPANLIWALGEMDGNSDASFTAFRDAGYGVDDLMVTVPGSYESEKIDPSVFKVVSSIGTNGGYPPSNMFDGNKGSFWHTLWGGSSPPYPHELSFEMDKSRAVANFTYTPRQGLADHIAHAYFYVSDDKDNWGEPVAEYVWKKGYTAEDKKIYCSKFKKGRFWKISITEFWRNGNPIGGPQSNIAEMEVHEYKGPAKKE